MKVSAQHTCQGGVFIWKSIAFPNSSSVYTFQRGGGFVGDEDWAEGEACAAALVRSNCSLLARAAHTQRARPLPPPSFPEPQRDALRLPFDHSQQGGEAESLRRSHRSQKEERSMRTPFGTHSVHALRSVKHGVLSAARCASCPS